MKHLLQNRLVAEIFNASLKAVDSYNAVMFYTDKIRSIYQNGKFKRLVVVGFGKASCLMAKALEDKLGDLIDEGIIITKHGHNIVQQSSRATEQQEIMGENYSSLKTTGLLNCCSTALKIYEAGHPLPDENSVKGTDEILRLLSSADKDTFVVCLISGGGSALLATPYEGISLREKQEMTHMLLKAGADIFELNTVRKHISRVKGGRLAEIAYPAKIISLILSDVIGDKLDVIASGPTAPDKTTFNDALNVLGKYRLIDKAPQSTLSILDKGVKSEIPETPKENNAVFSNVENIIIGSNKIALEAARAKAEKLGLKTEILSYEITGEARDIGRELANIARLKRSNSLNGLNRLNCLISGGETTVTVKGNGIGGRNMELALAFAIEIEGIDGITLLSTGTDGTDGTTDAAGAIVNGETIKKARKDGLNPEEFLNNNDSYIFFKKAGGLFVTAPTGTNVMDVQIMVIE